MDPVVYDVDADEEILSDSDDEGTVVDIEIETLEAWKVHMGHWVFEAQYGESAPQSLVDFFCGTGEGSAEVAKSLGEQVDIIRNMVWEEQLGAAKDAEAIRKVESAGDMEAGYKMRCAQGLYAQNRFAGLRDNLYQRLDAALVEVNKSRQELVDAGTFVAAKDVKVKGRRKKPTGDAASKRPRKGAEDKKGGVARIQFEKKKISDKAQGPGKVVSGHSAVDAVAEQTAN